MSTLIKRTFADSRMVREHQTGMVEAVGSGVEVIIHTRDGGDGVTPCSAEIICGEDGYAEIGLWFDEKELVDYDGVFSLPHEVVVLLEELGYVVGEDFR